jgi:membrane-bound metal-dependent hydrolase YbcI (DUF457 family)
MWPWGHLAVGYLVYAFVRRRSGKYPTEAGTVALAVGTQFPDLVDKPLAWSLGVLPNGRSLAHSLVIACVLWIVILGVARRAGHWEVSSAFVVGYAAHILADAVHPVVTGNLADLAFLAWPLLPPVVYDNPRSIVGHFLGLEPTAFLLFESILVVVALARWFRDGTPGIAALRGVLRISS